MRRIAILGLFTSVIATSSAFAQSYNMYDYWIMPKGRVLNRWNVFRQPGTCNPQAPVYIEHNYGWWRGSIWNRSVYLQAGPNPTSYDVMVDSNNRLEYWATYRGDDYDGPRSHGFGAPHFWMNRYMQVGDVLIQNVQVNEMDPAARDVSSSGTGPFRIEILAHFDHYIDPESGHQWDDVLQFRYNSSETYWQAKGIGNVRFETTNCQEPSGVMRQYLESYDDNVPFTDPVLPWFDPVNYKTFVRNGFMERFDVPTPQNCAPVTGTLKGWEGSTAGPSSDQRLCFDPGNTAPGQQPWRVLMRGSGVNGGDSLPDHVITRYSATDAFIPVEPGRKYILSGWLYRGSGQDNVYLDFNDGIGRSNQVEFNDAQAMSTQTNVWENVSATATVGPNTTGIRVRCVRDGANAGNALCDGVTLKRAPTTAPVFNDVPCNSPYFPFVEALAWYGVTGGCGNGNYCPDMQIPREQMAVFMTVARYGNFYKPPDCTTPPFADVAVDSPYCRFILAARNLQIMRGGSAENCTLGNFCPTAVVTRDQMAAFVLRAREGGGYAPPPCSPTNPMFPDVPASNPYCPFVEELARRHVVNGCGGGLYCPASPNTRGQMAVFIAETYKWPSPYPSCQ